MKAKKKPAGKRVVSNKGLGDFTAWMLYDATNTYDGFTLWTTQRMAKVEKLYAEEIGNAPIDGQWRISKVHVRFA